MELSKRHLKIIEAKMCPYCNSETRVVSELDIYGKEYKGRSVIACVVDSCDSYVGTHENGDTLGRLANKKLRRLKKEAHKNFDKLWKNKKMSRSKAYGILSSELGLPLEYAHIGMFSEKTCKKVINIDFNKYLI